MQSNPRVINFYAALAISLIVTVIIAGTIFLIGLLLTTQFSNSPSSDSFAVFIIMATLLLVLMFFFGLPALLNSRYGWKTVVITLIFQSIFLFFAVTAIAVISETGTIDQPSPYSSSPAFPEPVFD